MIKFEKKKLPPESRPPVFSVRVPENDYKLLTSELENLTAMINSRRPSGTKEIRKNQVFVEALKIGLSMVKADEKRKKS